MGKLGVGLLFSLPQVGSPTRESIGWIDGWAELWVQEDHLWSRCFYCSAVISVAAAEDLSLQPQTSANLCPALRESTGLCSISEISPKPLRNSCEGVKGSYCSLEQPSNDGGGTDEQVPCLSSFRQFWEAFCKLFKSWWDRDPTAHSSDFNNAPFYGFILLTSSLWVLGSPSKWHISRHKSGFAFRWPQTKKIPSRGNPKKTTNMLPGSWHGDCHDQWALLQDCFWAGFI